LYYGVHTPNFGDYGDPAILAELAHEAEDSGWDGFFIWDHILFWSDCPPLTDPWVALTAIALRTVHIRIGPLVTPLPRRRPWTLARQATSVDRLSGGRLILGVGIGDPVEYEFGWFGEPTDAKVRAAMLDEGLDILAGLWSGAPFAYQGTLPVARDDLRPHAHPAPAHPHLGGGLVAAQAAAAPGCPLGRRLPRQGRRTADA